MEELRSEIGLYPTWLPGDTMVLGSVGTFVRGSFRKVASLRDFGIDFTSRLDSSTTSFKMQRGMTFQAESRTTADIGVVGASITVAVGARSAYSWAFGASGVRKEEIEDVLQVQSAILAAVNIGTWKPAWLVISEVYHVDTLNIIVATSQDVRGNIDVKGKLATPGDVLLSHDTTYQLAAADFFVVANAKHTTPLFGLRQLQGLFSKGLVPISGGGENDELTLERALAAEMYPRAVEAG
jgi:hypothetical protein